jgi:hypothetical protein
MHEWATSQDRLPRNGQRGGAREGLSLLVLCAVVEMGFGAQEVGMSAVTCYRSPVNPSEGGHSVQAHHNTPRHRDRAVTGTGIAYAPLLLVPPHCVLSTGNLRLS